MIGWGNFSLKLQKIWIFKVLFISAGVNLIPWALCLSVLGFDYPGGKKVLTSIEDHPYISWQR